MQKTPSVGVAIIIRKERKCCSSADVMCMALAVGQRQEGT